MGCFEKFAFFSPLCLCRCTQCFTFCAFSVVSFCRLNFVSISNALTFLCNLRKQRNNLKTSFWRSSWTNNFEIYRSLDLEILIFLSGDKLQSYFTKEYYDVIDVGILHPDEVPVKTLYVFFNHLDTQRCSIDRKT